MTEDSLSYQDKYLEIYKYMLMSRESDIVESELVNSGEANFLASSKGHEGSAVLEPFLKTSDYLHCHYRDKALMLARGISSDMFFYSALAYGESHSHGRQMVSHMSARELNILSIVGPVGNNALQAVGIATVIKKNLDNPLVLCSMGDGTTQQGEVFEAIAEARRSELPVLFFIHNNNLAISTDTRGKTFFSLPDGSNPETFYGLPITYIDGINPLKSYSKIESIINQIRSNRLAQIIVFNVDRLDNHSNADNQKLYRTDDQIEISLNENDPLKVTYDFLSNLGIDKSILDKIKTDAIKSVRDSLVKVKSLGSIPAPCFSAEKELLPELQVNASEYRGDFATQDRLTMLEAMKEVLRRQLNNDDRVYLFGEDIEDDKGDVFGITRSLSTEFNGRVVNSPLSESTIVGMSVGMALANMKPVAFIQFADFMPVAYNQIFSELATMYWRTNGSWQCPVIILAACGGYRPGLGPFHSQTNEATYAHIPGLDVFMPSTAADAVGLLNSAFKSGRPSLFLYPKKLLNNSSNSDTTSVDIGKQIVPIGKARIVKSGSDITLVGYGNTVNLCHMVSDILDSIGIDVEIIDLRTIKPYDLDTILRSVNKTGHLIVTHEDNQTCSISSEILASVLEKSKVAIKAKRVVRTDTFTPCNYINQLEVLPSYESILTASCELLNIDLTWEAQGNIDATSYIIEVIGASPSDESVIINKLHIKVGDKVTANDILVDIEASKSAGEILSPYSGVVEEIYVKETEKALVGKPLLKIKLDETNAVKSKVKKKAVLKKNFVPAKVVLADLDNVITNVGYPVGMSIPTFKTGSRRVDNQELLLNFKDFTNEDIIDRTGIQTRYWLDLDENIVDIAVATVKQLFDQESLKLNDIDIIICATCSPEEYQSPSMACLVLDKLSQIYGEHSIGAYDLNAACSGFIYALQNAKDYLVTRPNKKVLLITLEALSKRIDRTNFDTTFLFGDACSAAIVYGNDFIEKSKLLVENINLTATAEDGSILNIPLDNNCGIKLQGKRLFSFAVKTMAMVMHKCCQDTNISLSDVDLVIPHQANQRIIDAVESRLKLAKGTLYSNIAKYGNTSSCTIPIALAETLPTTKAGSLVGLSAFGAGFTAGAAILKVIR